MDEISIQLMNRYRNGDELAADEIYGRYVARLIGLASKRISEKFQQRVDAEDVVQSVYRSFFIRAGDGQFEIRRSGDLWRLLAAITVNKVRKKARFHKQQKRSADNELAIDDYILNSVHLAAGDPGPEEAISLDEELSVVMTSLDDEGRMILEMRLQDHDLEEIARRVGRSQRTVRRKLDKVRAQLENRLWGVVEK
jgi:RNA polymerase sigma factor (sigma-70 family)